MAKENFGERLARLRKENNLTQSDIADKLKFSNELKDRVGLLVRLHDTFFY